MEGTPLEDGADGDWFEVPAALRVWFAIHAAVSVVVGVPLFFGPEIMLRTLGWATVDVGASRLVGAALLAIGVASYRSRFEGLAVFRALLGLKILWSGLGLFALFGAIGAGAPSAVWLLLFAFLVFLGVWTHYAIVFRRVASAGPTAFSYGDPDAGSAAQPEQAEPEQAEFSEESRSRDGAAS